MHPLPIIIVSGLKGILFGLLMLAFDLLKGKEISIMKCLLMTLVFGIFMSLIFVSFFLYKLRKKGIIEITLENIRVNQSTNMKSTLN